MIKGLIFDIQYYAIYDGPGIRTLVFFKGCPLTCKWCHNPESQSTKLQIGYLEDNCVGCGECVKVCPEKAIKLKNKKVVRDSARCVVCGKCASACPNRATELIGEEVTPEEITERVLRDKPFYDNSGGGVTFSGGEATMQPGFLIATLRLMKEKGIHTAIETAGFFKENLAGELTGLVDLFLFDIKHADSELHKKMTGVSTDLIQRNFKRLLKSAGVEKVLPRIPLIPGFNTDSESAAGIVELLKRAGYEGEVHFMPYNRMASTKYKKIGQGGAYKDFGELRDEDIESFKKCFESIGFKVKVSK